MDLSSMNRFPQLAQCEKIPDFILTNTKHVWIWDEAEEFWFIGKKVRYAKTLWGAKAPSDIELNKCIEEKFGVKVRCVFDHKLKRFKTSTSKLETISNSLAECLLELLFEMIKGSDESKIADKIIKQDRKEWNRKSFKKLF